MIKPYDQDLINVIVCQTFKLKSDTIETHSVYDLSINPSIYYVAPKNTTD